MEKLREGYARFRKELYEKNTALFQQLAQKQRPEVMFVACCDSRADPAMITGANPGELFTVRNIANIVPPSERASARQGTRHGTSAALEFAVTGLQVAHIIVLGHAGCGGIEALMTGAHVGIGHDFVQKWMSTAEPARQETLAALPDASPEEQARHCEMASIKISLKNLMTFTCVEEQVTAGKLSLHGWYFDIAEGTILEYNPETDAFEPF